MKANSLLSVGAVALILSPLAAQAQGAAEFYKGKTVSIIVSTGAGGGYDSLARGLARHLANRVGDGTRWHCPGGGQRRAGVE